MVLSEAARTGTIETRRSWLVAWSALGILCISLGAPLITVVALKPIAAEFGDIRSVPSLAYSLAWLGSAAGGIAMGLVAERVGVRWTVIFGAVMIAAGLVLSSLGGRIALYLGHGLFIGLLGNAGINAPLYVYVARWFDRRRGTALALIASGQAAAGTVLAPVFGHTIGWFGWRHTMQIYATLAIVFSSPWPSWSSGNCRGLRATSKAGMSRQRRSSASARTPYSRFCAWRASCAVFRWRCRKAISWPFAMISAFPLPAVARCYR